MKTALEECNPLLQQSYKKMKSSAYFDRTNPALREQIVAFEKKCNGNIDRALQELASKLWGTNEQWNQFTKEKLKQISAYCYPKKLMSADKSKKDDDNQPVFITNSQTKNVYIEEVQYMANIPVEFHVLGVLWLLLIGYKVDNNIYDKAYGNRIRKKLRNEFSKKPTYSPYLFEPYFEQYQSWRDTALEDAKKCLKNNQDVVIMTLDLKRYFYSIDVTKKTMACMTKEVMGDIQLSKQFQRLNNLIADICHCYAAQVDDKLTGKRNIAPIGFLPSNVISNWFLSGFDRAISDGWNPVYYGRYVDDILIVDKVEKNSEIFKNAQAGTLTPEEVISFFLLQCSRWNGPKQSSCAPQALLIPDTDKKGYRIQQQYLPKDSCSEVYLQNKKVKVFYFSASESDALLHCFRSNIALNASEFRFMPEEEAAFKRNDYSEIYELNQESINKLRDIKGIGVDKFSLSKFLGKYLRIGGIICDRDEKLFEKDLGKIMNVHTTIENYTMWEKIVEILVANEQFDALLEFCKNTIFAIKNITCKETTESAANQKSAIQNALALVLVAALNRGLSLCWKNSVKLFCEEYDHFVEKEWSDKPELLLTMHSQTPNWYLKSRMSDKSSMAILPDFFLYETSFLTNDAEVNLTVFSEVLQKLSCTMPELLSSNPKDAFSQILQKYNYQPYMITMYDLSIAQAVLYLINKQVPIPADDYNAQWDNYLRANYQTKEGDNQSKKEKMVRATSIKLGVSTDIDVSVIAVGNEKKEQLKLALANVRLKESAFKKAIDEDSDRTYHRYEELSKIVNQAVKANADMLIIPESYTPFEWLSILARTCAKNQLAVVTGVEHIVVNKVVYNLTATILPFQEDDYSCAQIFFHLKNHYAPFETKSIKDIRLKIPEQEKKQPHYELFCWNDCWFPVYCCYELCSIQERAIFQAYADILVAVEWNKDVNHYSNVLESLGRDLHCYCVQANSSNYGDSRIFAPTKTEQKDIIRTKGGQNPTVLVDTVNIKALRDFQFGIGKDYNFKPIPPLFNLEIVSSKRKHQLYENISKSNI